MKPTSRPNGEGASANISKRIQELGDWRGETPRGRPRQPGGVEMGEDHGLPFLLEFIWWRRMALICACRNCVCFGSCWQRNNRGTPHISRVSKCGTTTVGSGRFAFVVDIRKVESARARGISQKASDAICRCAHIWKSARCGASLVCIANRIEIKRYTTVGDRGHPR